MGCSSAYRGALHNGNNCAQTRQSPQASCALEALFRRKSAQRRHTTRLKSGQGQRRETPPQTRFDHASGHPPCHGFLPAVLSHALPRAGLHPCRRRLHRHGKGAEHRRGRCRHPARQGAGRSHRHDKDRRRGVLQGAVYRLRHRLPIHHKRRNGQDTDAGFLPSRQDAIKACKLLLTRFCSS